MITHDSINTSTSELKKCIVEELKEKNKLAEQSPKTSKNTRNKKRRDNNSFYRSTSWELVCRRYSVFKKKIIKINCEGRKLV